ncbi:MAG: glycyl-radical enzyme activating protein [Erysipelotrichaceae bacterium]|nr:glycyl-radical enzyme activating protein [Erysipelotrichaceae bacterium]
MSGTIFDIKRYAIHDGTGIRTTVFFKGCPLRCMWCHNPEGLSCKPQLGYTQNTCMQCQRCIHVCRKKNLSLDNGSITIGQNCDLCEDCIDICPTNSLKMIGQTITLAQLEEIIKKDMIFYDTTDGGVTFSGGEVFLQPEFLRESLKLCHELGLHTTIESSFMTDFNWIEQVIPYVDQFIVDIKLMDEAMHQKYTGCKNQVILNNIRQLSTYDVPLLIRTPLIPNITATKENLQEIGAFLRSLPRKIEIELLNYNPLAESKYPMIQEEYQLKGAKPFSSKEMNVFEQYVKGEKDVV